MSIQIKLYADDEKFNVLDFSFSFSQKRDINGRPSAKPLCNGVHIVIEAQKYNGFIESAMQANHKMQLVLHFIPVQLGSKTRKLHLIDAHCVRNKVHFNAKSAIPMTESLFFTCGGVKDSNSNNEFSASWRTTFPKTEAATTMTYNNEKEFTNCYLTYPDGEPLEYYDKGDIIILNIETLNRIGDNVTVNLDDAEFDFEYNGSVLPNDVLSNIAINNDLEQVALKVVAQKEN